MPIEQMITNFQLLFQVVSVPFIIAFIGALKSANIIVSREAPLIALITGALIGLGLYLGFNGGGLVNALVGILLGATGGVLAIGTYEAGKNQLQ